MNLVTPNELRGAGVAFFSATIGLVAMSLGAILIAAISDYVYGGNAIGLGMATLFAICLPAGLAGPVPRLLCPCATPWPPRNPGA